MVQKAQLLTERWIRVINVLVQKPSYEVFHGNIKGVPVDNCQILPNSVHCGAVLHLSQKYTTFISVCIASDCFVALGWDLCYCHWFKLRVYFIFSSIICDLSCAWKW